MMTECLQVRNGKDAGKCSAEVTGDSEIMTLVAYLFIRY